MIQTALNLTIKYRTLLRKNKIDSPERLGAFFGQSWVESKFLPRRESLNYKVEALLKLFSRKRISEEQAKKYGRTATQKANQRMLGNILYGGEFGKVNLGNTEPNDGFNFRGSGSYQITGRWNFQQLSDDTGIDFVNNPDLLLDETNSLIAAIWFWNRKKFSELADKGEILQISKAINLGNPNHKGTPNHAKERQEATEELTKAFTQFFKNNKINKL